MTEITGKNVLITGAASGIGRELSFQIAKMGGKIATVDCDRPGLEQLASEIEQTGGSCQAFAFDLSMAEQRRALFDRVTADFGSVDILINNAGIGCYGPTHELPEDKRNQILSVNLEAPFALFQLFVHQLMASSGGHLVNVSSIYGLVPQQRAAAYCASKYGLVGLSEAIRAEYGRYGLGVTLVCPGFVDTPLLKKLPTVSDSGAKLKPPPKWLTTSPAKVAKKIIRGIERNKRLVVVTPLAHMLYHVKRLFPGVFDFVQLFKSSSLKQTIPFLRRKNKSVSPPEESTAQTSTQNQRRAA